MSEKRKVHFEDKITFQVYKEWDGIVDMLSDSQAGKLFKALFTYATEGETADLHGMAKMALYIMTRQLDRDGKKWEETCEKRSENGKKGGRPKSESSETSETAENTELSEEKTNCFSEKAKEPEKEEEKEKEKENEKEKEKESKSVAAAPRSRFEKPTVNDIIRYCYENNYSIDAQAFCDYYDSVGWRVGNKPMKDWRAAVRTWVRREQSGSNVHQPAFISSTPQSSPQPEPVFEDYLGILAAVRESS